MTGPSAGRILLVDDEVDLLDVYQDILRDTVAEIVCESDPKRAIALIARESFDLLVTDIRMPGMDGLELLRRAREHDPNLSTLLITAFPTDETISESVQLGAVGYVTKPVTPEQLRVAVERAVLDRRSRALSPPSDGDECEGLYGRSAPMRAISATIATVGPKDVDLLILGEFGTGKEMVARAVHARSRRAAAPFVSCQCGPGLEAALEIRLFGGSPGPLGSAGGSGGLLTQAEGGTLFIDEVAAMPMGLQAKLMHVGASAASTAPDGRPGEEFDVRVIAASGCDLDREVAQGRFRQDLLYRLAAVTIALPPLRERDDDVWGLFQVLVQREGPRIGRSARWIDPAVRGAIETYGWPGNVREMLKAVRGTLARGRGDTIHLHDLPPEIVCPEDPTRLRGEGFFERRDSVVRTFECRYLVEALRRAGGDVTEAAKAADIPRGTFYRLMGKYELRAADYRA